MIGISRMGSPMALATAFGDRLHRADDRPLAHLLGTEGAVGVVRLDNDVLDRRHLAWDGINNVVFKQPNSSEVLVDKPNNQINLDVVGLNDADGFMITTPTKFADVSATINVTLP